MTETPEIEETMNEARIRDLREQRGWSQERLAAESGVAVRTIQRLEAGNDASLATLSLVAKALEVTVRDLFVSVDSDRFATAMDDLDVRIEEDCRGRARARRALNGWRYLYVGLGVAITAVAIVLVSATGSGATILMVPAYWVGGLLVLLFFDRSVLTPRLDARYPLAAAGSPSGKPEMPTGRPSRRRQV